MNKANVLYHYTEGQIEVKKKELQALKQEQKSVNERVTELETLIEALEEQLPEIQARGTVSESKSYEEMAWEPFKLNHSEDGIRTPDAVEFLETKYGKKAPSYNFVEKNVNLWLNSGRLIQTNPQARRNKRYKIASDEGGTVLRGAMGQINHLPRTAESVSLHSHQIHKPHEEYHE